jgi:short-subunit dehydrogenase
MKKGVAIITGASSGIGLALAQELARQGHNLLLTARMEAELEKVAESLQRNYGVGVAIVAKDLTQRDAAEEIFEVACCSYPGIDILINNAGVGQRANFWEYPFARDREMIRTNVEAVVGLTKFFLPPMLERGSGRVMNTASIAGFEPGPLLAVYHATKAFVLSFTEALAVEVEGHGVSVTALCPGAPDTDFYPKADMVGTKIFQKHKVMAPQEVAVAAYRAMMRGERVCVPGAMNKALVFSRRLTTLPRQARMNKSIYEKAPPEKRKRRRGDVEKETVPDYRKERLKRGGAWGA